MITNRIHRRAVLAGAAAIAASHAVRPSVVRAEGVPKGYVLAANEGEHLIQRGGNIFIKADPARGAGGLALGAQQILTNVGIAVRRHFEIDEAFYVIEGPGTFILDDWPPPVAQGRSIFMPKKPSRG